MPWTTIFVTALVVGVIDLWACVQIGKLLHRRAQDYPIL